MQMMDIQGSLQKDLPLAQQKKKIERQQSKLKMKEREEGDVDEATPFGGREMTFKISRETRADREKQANVSSSDIL